MNFCSARTRLPGSTSSTDALRISRIVRRPQRISSSPISPRPVNCCRRNGFTGCGNCRQWARTPIYGQVTLWQWVGLFLSVMLGILIPCLYYRWQNRRPVPDSLVWRAWRRLFGPTVIILSVMLVRYLAEDVINITGNVHAISVEILVAGFYLTAAWLAVVIGGGTRRDPSFPRRISTRRVSTPTCCAFCSAS